MGKIAIRADRYFNNQNRYSSMWGDMACPVDLNAGYVAQKTDKWGMDETCGDETQDNIRERFGLEAPDNAKDGDYDE